MIDGSHRCDSCDLAGVSFPTFIFVGFDASATLDMFDNVNVRSIGAKLLLARPDMVLARPSAAIVSLCSELIAGSYVRLGTLGDYDRGAALVANGLAWVLHSFHSKHSRGLGSFRQTAITGAFAFASKADSRRIHAIAESLIHRKVGTTGFVLPPQNSPETFLFHKLEEHFQGGAKGGGNGRRALMRGIFNVLMLAVKSPKPPSAALKTAWLAGFVSGDTTGEDFFAKNYTGSEVNRLRAAWKPLKREAAASKKAA
jgi:hypothetical protein